MLHAVIMAGGSGTRFWPRSRQQRPKQLLSIVGKRALLVETCERLRGLVPWERIHVITNAEYVSDVRRLLEELPRENVVGEPVGRDTAAAIALSAARLARIESDATMLVLPSDHVIQPHAEFLRTVRAGLRLLEEYPNTLVTFGIRPTCPATGYGYIKRGEERGGHEGVACYAAQAFKEKPDEGAACAFLAEGGYYWNAGIFAWRAAAVRSEIRRHLPELDALLQSIECDLFTEREEQALARVYQEFPRISIDFGVMERAADRSIVEATFEWDDVGSWLAIEKYHAKDDRGNVCLGEVLVLDGAGNIIDAGGGLVAVLGLSDLVVVRTEDAVLVCPKAQCQNVKRIVEELRRRGKGKVL
ncbi:MAG: sugar phosphate nucleotidyltransferase [Planctomycetota bacterium]